ncbi:MAG TPA: hypothetical protein VFS43_47585 [Polyangiaceae bacterium]|nr:hypothetical protein [Polyangiaceae bacterium]
MKEVLRYIFEKKRAYATLPLFEWLRDERLDPRERLAFYPCMAHFILSFGDLNKFVLREEPPADVYQEMVNAHTREDDHHWPWYLEDFAELGFDVWLPPTEWMRFLWGDETEQNRRLMAGLTALARGATGVERLVIIEAIEETGNVLFGAMLPLAEVLERRLGRQLRYCGSFHFERESGHTVGADHAELARIALTPAQRERCRALVNEVFTLFEAWTHELLRYAMTHGLRGTGAGSGTFRAAPALLPGGGAAERDAAPAPRPKKLGS